MIKSFPIIPHYQVDNPLQREIERRGLSLHVSPLVPETSYPVDQRAANQYLAVFDPRDEQGKRYYDVVKKGLESMQHLTMASFSPVLKAQVRKLNDALDDAPYAVGVAHGKSNHWVTSLALKDLERLPQSEFSLGSNLGTCNLHGQILEVEENISSVSEDTLVLFDDCCYSGQQICYVAGRISALRDKTVYIVVPHMTETAQGKLRALAERHEDTLSLEIITSDEKIRPVSQVFTQEELDTLAEITRHFATCRPEIDGQTLCYSDWRLPDGASFSKFAQDMKKVTKVDGEYWTSEDTKKDIRFVPAKIPRPYAIDPLSTQSR